MKLNKILSLGVGVAIILLGAASVSAEGYVTLTKNKPYQTAFADAAWSEEVSDPSTRDYLVANGYYYSGKPDEKIPCKSLTFGVIGGTIGHFYLLNTIDAESCFEKLILANGTAHTRYAGERKVNADVEITSPATAPFTFDDVSLSDGKKPFRHNGYCNFTQKFSGASDAGIYIAAWTNDYVVEISGDASQYYGSVVVDTYASESYTATGRSATFKLNNTTFNGSVICKDRTTFATAGDRVAVKSVKLENGSTLSLGAPTTIENLEVGDDYTLSFSVNPKSAAPQVLLNITRAISRTGGRKIPVAFTYTSGSFALPPQAKVTYPLFTVAADVELGEDDFELKYPLAEARKTVYLKMTVDSETGVKTFALETYPSMARTEWPNESGEYGASKGDVHKISEVMFDDSTAWSDNLVPHSGAHYFVDRYTNPADNKHGTTYARTPYLPEGEFRFGGESITLAQSCHLVLMSKDVYFKRLDMYSSNNIYCSYDSDVTIHGDLYVGNQTLKIQPANYHTFTLDGKLLGSGGVTIAARTAAAAGLNGNARFSGDNSAFTGVMTVMIPYSAGKTPRWEDKRYASLYVSNQNNLGGPRAEFTYNALSISNFCELITEDNVTFDDQTRGMLLSLIAQFTTPNDNVLTIKQQLTLNGTIYKNGTGTLALGGALKFLDSEGAITDVVPVDATNHMMIVTGGTLKPIAARSLDGLNIRFTNKGPMDGYKAIASELKIDANLAALKDYGMVNVKAESPFAVAGTLTSIPLKIENLPIKEEAYEVPICTIRASEAATALALLKTDRRVTLGQKNAKVSLVASAPFMMDDVQAVTIKAVVTPAQGLLFILR